MTAMTRTLLCSAPGDLIEIDRQARLDWMRAEFRAAQQRRYETAGIVLAKRAAVAEPESASEAEPPTLATPSG